MYYIYDHICDAWHYVSFSKFESAEREMQRLIKKREENNAPHDFAIYERIT